MIFPLIEQEAITATGIEGTAESRVHAKLLKPPDDLCARRRDLNKTEQSLCRLI
jgi:hypothetical protein